MGGPVTAHFLSLCLFYSSLNVVMVIQLHSSQLKNTFLLNHLTSLFSPTQHLHPLRDLPEPLYQSSRSRWKLPALQMLNAVHGSVTDPSLFSFLNKVSNFYV